MKNIFSKFYYFIAVLLFLPIKAFALLDSNTGLDIQDGAIDFSEKAGFDLSAGLGGYIEMIITAFLSVLGIIFIILIIIAGFNWMTAAGDESKITRAKDTIQRAVIGLIIIAAAYAITYFVFSVLPGPDGPGAGGPVAG